MWVAGTDVWCQTILILGAFWADWAVLGSDKVKEVFHYGRLLIKLFWLHENDLLCKVKQQTHKIMKIRTKHSQKWKNNPTDKLSNSIREAFTLCRRREGYYVHSLGLVPLPIPSRHLPYPFCSSLFYVFYALYRRLCVCLCWAWSESDSVWLLMGKEIKNKNYFWPISAK